MVTVPAAVPLRTETTSRRAQDRHRRAGHNQPAVRGRSKEQTSVNDDVQRVHYRLDGISAGARKRGLRTSQRSRRVPDGKSLAPRPPAKSRVLTYHSQSHSNQITSRSDCLRGGLARRQRSQTSCASSSAAPSQVLNGAPSWPQTKN